MQRRECNVSGLHAPLQARCAHAFRCCFVRRPACWSDIHSFGSCLLRMLTLV